MNIGFVSAWNERGASYVTKAYIDALKENNKLFLYERGSDNTEYLKSSLITVTHGLRLFGTAIDFRHFRRWIEANRIELVFFNEQHDFEIIIKLKLNYPQLIIGTYIDYYKRSWVSKFQFFDFLICNTKRHYSVFKHISGAHYVPWGSDIDVYSPQKKHRNTDEIVFFHSAGMSLRKGTDKLIDVFVKNDFWKKSKLIIHTQIDINNFTTLTENDLKKNRIEIIHRTVTAPGLYHLGDVYVYPTTLDGLGLTMYEALLCGMPVIATDDAPMNEIINNSNGKLVKVSKFISRDDGYYWPLSIIDDNSLIECMDYYCRLGIDGISSFSNWIREDSVKKYNWRDRIPDITSIFCNATAKMWDPSVLKDELRGIKEEKKIRIKELCGYILPNPVINYIRNKK